MSDILLVHGAAHGAWCWHRVLPLLRAMGHAARAIDLPAHGDDPTDPSEVTLDLYADAILQATQGPTILVGHSMGGFPITAAAQRAPERFAALVYLCAYLPVAGQTLAEMRRTGPSQPLAGSFILDDSRTTFTFDPARAPALFYHDCRPKTWRWPRAGCAPNPSARRKPPFPTRRAPKPCRASTSAVATTAPSRRTTRPPCPPPCPATMC